MSGVVYWRYINRTLMGKIIGLVIAAVFLIGGFLYWNSRDKVSMEVIPDASTTTKGMVPTPAMEEKGVVSSIKDAMGLGQKMQCTYVMNDGDKSIESKVVVDGKKFFSTTATGEMIVYALFDGENQYSWTSASKTGMQMSKACLEKMKESVKDMPTAPETPMTPKDMQSAFDVAKNVKCEPAGSVDFALPKDVTFTDQCAMMEQSMQMMKDMKDKLPAGMTVPGMPTPVQ